MSQTKQMRPGFRPNGDGPDGARYGRDPVSNRSYLRDGSLRKERVTKSPQEVLQGIEDARRRACATVGRGVIKAAPGLSAFVKAAGTFRKWLRDAVAYGSPEKVTERRAYFARMLAAVDAKHDAAVAFLPGAEKSRAVLDNLSATVGEAFLVFREKNGRDPSPDEVDTILATIIPQDVREQVESAGDPSRDPFATFRRDAADAGPEDDEDGDDLSTDGDDA